MDNLVNFRRRNGSLLHRHVNVMIMTYILLNRSLAQVDK